MDRSNHENEDEQKHVQTTTTTFVPNEEDDDMDVILNDMNIDDDYNILFTSCNHNDAIDEENFDRNNLSAETASTTLQPLVPRMNGEVPIGTENDEEDYDSSNSGVNDNINDIEVIIQTSPSTTTKKNRNRIRSLLSFRKPLNPATTTTVVMDRPENISTAPEDTAWKDDESSMLQHNNSTKHVHHELLTQSIPTGMTATTQATAVIENQCFSKHYVLSSKEQEQILQLQFDIFGTKQSLTKIKATPTFLPSLWFGTATSKRDSKTTSLQWNEQIDFWNRIIVPTASVATATVEPHTLPSPVSSGREMTSVSERSISSTCSKNVKDITNRSKSILVWRSDGNSNVRIIDVVSTTTETPNECQLSCELIVLTTGIMVIAATTTDEDRQQPTNSNSFGRVDTNDDDTTQVPQRYIIIAVIPWTDSEYIEIYSNTTNGTQNRKLNQTVGVNDTAESETFGPNHHNDDAIDEVSPDVQAATDYAKAMYLYGIRCHYCLSHVDPEASHASTDIASNTFTTKSSQKKDKYASNIDEKTKPRKCTATIVFDSQQQRNMVYRLFVNVMIQYHTYHPCAGILKSQNNGTRPEREDEQHQVLGWQYHLYYVPYFTMAVTNMLDDINQSECHELTTANGINQLDEYNGMAPIHYAVYYNHVPAIARLAEICSGRSDPIDFNLCDEINSWTPLDYCIMYQLPSSTMDLLSKYGAAKVTVATVNSKKSPLLYEMKGELFSKVMETEQIIDERRHRRREIEHQQRMVEEQKNNNYNLLLQLQHRGEQIDALSNGATNLNQNANEYASMAKQLKERTKRQHEKYNTWFPFG